MQKGFVVTILCLLLIFALPLMARAETLLDPAPVPATTTDSSGSGHSGTAPAAPDNGSKSGSSSGGIPYRTVTPEEFSGKINTLIGEVKQSLDKLVIPTSEVIMIVLLLVLLVGSLIGSLFGLKKVYKYALAGLGCTAVVLIFYYSIPSIIGFINHVASVINS